VLKTMPWRHVGRGS